MPDDNFSIETIKIFYKRRPFLYYNYNEPYFEVIGANMLKLSLIAPSLLLIVVLLVIPGLSMADDWPLKREVDLSSGFGDFRDGHFHGGIDFRTGGKIGAEIVSPVDGYVWRVVMSYSGYGKGLYIMGDDGYLYVYGHLSQMAEKIDVPVKQAQIASKRYYQDIYFPKDSIRVTRGEFLAYTGQAGKGGPHLHFEKRTADNTPINPLTNGLKLDDKTRPTFTRLGIQLTDDHSLLSNGRRKLYVDASPSKGAGKFGIDTLLYLNRPFGLLVDGFDQMRSGGMKQTIYRLRLYIDDQLMYDTRFDSLSYETTDAVRLEYDYVEAADGRKRVRRLFKIKGNRFSGSSGRVGSGLFGGKGGERVGRHTVRIVGDDNSGNRSVLRFDFLWGPPEYIYNLDSVVTPEKRITEYYFTPVAGYKEFGIDSVEALRNVPGWWGHAKEVSIIPLENGRIMCRIESDRTSTALLALFVYCSNGVIRDNIFNGMHEQQADRVFVTWEVVDDGLLVMLDNKNKKASYSRVELYRGDSLLGVEFPQYFDLSRHICFVPPRPEYELIDRIGAAMTRDTAHHVRTFSDSANIHRVGHRDRQVVAVDNRLELTFNRANLYEPRFVELKRNYSRHKAIMQLNSAHYQILPEAFVTREDFQISLKIPGRKVNRNPSGICWLDKKKDRWVWLDNEREGDVLNASSQGGGSFAAVFDYKAPLIRNLSVREGRKFTTPRPRITFLAIDSLSGIEDDRAISVKIDAKWQIVDFDPETERCEVQLFEPLAPGPHHLAIIIYDRAGNMTEQYLNFTVTAKKKRRK